MKEIKWLVKFISYVLMFLCDAIQTKDNIEKLYAKTKIFASISKKGNQWFFNWLDLYSNNGRYLVRLGNKSF